MTRPDALVHEVDARCMCAACGARTTDTYVMIGYCRNCGHKAIAVTYRSGDRSRDVDCPACGCWHTVTTTRLASTEDGVSQS